MQKSTHRRPARRPEPIPATDAWVTNECSSGKRAFFRRCDARKAARRLHDPRLHAFPCAECGAFHIGHLPEMVVRGDAARGDLHRSARLSHPRSAAAFETTGMLR